MPLVSAEGHGRGKDYPSAEAAPKLPIRRIWLGRNAPDSALTVTQWLLIANGSGLDSDYADGGDTFDASHLGANRVDRRIKIPLEASIDSARSAAERSSRRCQRVVPFGRDQVACEHRRRLGGPATLKCRGTVSEPPLSWLARTPHRPEVAKAQAVVNHEY